MIQSVPSECSAHHAASADTLARLFDARCAERGDRPAYVVLRDSLSIAHRLSYAELGEQSRALAARLSTVTRPGDRVLLALPTGLDFVRAFWACMLTGRVAVPVPPPDPIRLLRAAPRLRLIIEDAGASLVLVGESILQLTADVLGSQDATGARWLTPSELLSLEPAEPALSLADAPAGPETLAYLQYTSGSTSAPRGVCITHGNALANARALIVANGGNADSRVLTWLPQFHDYGLVFGVLAPMELGIGSWLMSPLAFLRRPLRWLDALADFRITHSGAPDSAYAACLRHLAGQPFGGDLSSLVSLSCGAEPIRADTVRRFLEACAPAGLRPTSFSPGYGLAESVLGVTLARRNQPPRLLHLDAAALQAHQVRKQCRADAASRTLVGCGSPLEDTEVAIVAPDTHLRRAADGIGEIWVRSPAVGAGYWQQPELTRHTFGATLADETGPWLRTGDLGFIDDGELFVTGRHKDLIVIHGENHYPQDIERTAERAHPAIRAGFGAAFGIDGEQGEAVVVVLEVERSTTAADAADIARTVRRAVAQTHEVPIDAVAVVRAGTLHRTSSGKLQRQSSRKAWIAGEIDLLAMERQGHGTAQVAPRDAGEQAVWDIWQEVLGTSAFGVLETFAELGGTSLTMSQVASRLHDRLGVLLPLEALFEHATVAALAGRVAEALRDDARAPATPIATVPRGQPLPVSLSQRRMWVIQQFNPASVAYHVEVSLRLRGPFDPDLLQRVLDRLVERHEGLRTHFRMEGAEPVQLILPSLPIQVEHIDLQALDPGERLARARALLRERAATPFDLAHPPLHRLTLLRLSGDDHVFFWLMHHAIADNWSMAVLMREMLALYSAWRGGREPRLATLPVEYADYAVWQRSPETRQQRQRQMAYWVERLRGLRPLSLPTDFVRPPHPASHGARVSAALPLRLRDRVRTFCSRHSVTPFVVLLAAFKVMLARQADRTDIAVGTPIANRHHLATEQLVGTLVNTLVMRTDLSGDPSFLQLMRRVRDTALGAYANQDAPYDELVEALGQGGMTQPDGLVRVLFNVLNAPVSGLEPVDFSYEDFEHEHTASQFDFSIHIDTEFAHRIRLEYSTELYASVTAERMLENFIAVIEQVLAEPERRLSAYSVVAPAQLALLRNIWNGTQLQLPVQQVLHRHLRTASEALRDRVAVVDASGRQMRYGELEAQSNVLARALRARGIARGHRVGLCLRRNAGMLAALLAVLKSGAAYVPLDPAFPVNRLRYMAQDADLSAILVPPDLGAPFDDVGVPLLDPNDPGTAADASPLALAPDVALDAQPLDAAYIIYTSGSTGQPKGVVVPHRAVVNFLVAMAREPGLLESDRLVAVTTLSFDIAVLELLLPLAVGAEVIVASREQVGEPTQLRELLERREATVMQATPSAWRALVDTGWTGGPGFRALVGGEALQLALAEQLMERSTALWNMYGPTETTVWSTCWQVQSPAQGISIGRPIGNTSVWVLDPHGQPCAIGVPGEACIGGMGVALGYHRRDALTAERFVPDRWSDEPGARLYRTGDLVRWRHDGLLEHLGRLDHQVKVRGFRIELGEIEAALTAHPSVSHCVVVTHVEGEDDVRLVAYCVPQRHLIDPAALREFLREHLPEYMLPQHIVRLPELPLLPNGKIDRHALPKPVGEVLMTPQRRSARLQTPEEITMAGIWSDLLGVEDLSPLDNFFDLGGHSLLAMRAVLAMRERLGWDVAPIRLVYETLGQIAQKENLARR
ncbi:amino acid adenylation domain-containing protein [Variovorax sp. J22R24]|uniref:non-ribosomal peptide synthetase n=1 Tax=Variovorax gracilis TaxID=3053502 RepID=UPI0025782FF7|nr:non-ribosomal peptide synthetase [Variovorax sp. J22R24]MDM0109354.1 amino acid adenylation domain-containing protein [Variovorax sp. J22R24]